MAEPSSHTATVRSRSQSLSRSRSRSRSHSPAVTATARYLSRSHSAFATLTRRLLLSTSHRMGYWLPVSDWNVNRFLVMVSAVALIVISALGLHAGGGTAHMVRLRSSQHSAHASPHTLSLPLCSSPLHASLCGRAPVMRADRERCDSGVRRARPGGRADDGHQVDAAVPDDVRRTRAVTPAPTLTPPRAPPHPRPPSALPLPPCVRHAPFTTG